MLKVVQGADNYFRKPKTCKQTGNNAPRFKWPAAIRVLIHMLALDQGTNDDELCSQGVSRCVDKDRLYARFIKIVPWFEDLYNEAQKRRAVEIGYPVEKLEPFGPSKVENRLRYLFDEPGRSGIRPRRYGISVEHYKNPKASRRKVHLKCSEQIVDIIKSGETISKEQVEEWSRDEDKTKRH
jgi:hypothetical protein